MPEEQRPPPRALAAFILPETYVLEVLAADERFDPSLLPPGDISRSPDIPPPRHA
jgi:hypothetical protein